jgi:hypothetical protein
MMASVPLRISIAMTISVGLIGVSDMPLFAQGGHLQTKPAPGLRPLPPPTGSTGTLQSSTEFKTLQGVQRLEEHVAYLEGLLKAMGSKIYAINTKETMNAITESVDSAGQCCNSSRQDVLVAG